MPRWRKIKDCPGYQVSDTGRVRSVARHVIFKDGRIAFYRGQEMKLTVRKDRYLQVRLKHRRRGWRNYLVSRLVAVAFIPNPENKPEVNHKRSKDFSNNHVDNLEWVTTQENVRHANANGAINRRCGESHPDTKLTGEMVVWLRTVAKILRDRRGKYVSLSGRLFSKYGIRLSATTIRLVVVGISWKYVPNV
jgi:hypothetical protein